MAFRENLIYLRSAHNLTQERLAVLLGVSRQAISKWESGKAYPEMDKLLTMSEVFNCSLDVLVRGDVREDSPTAQDKRATLAENRTGVMKRASQAIKKSLGVAGSSSPQVSQDTMNIGVVSRGVLHLEWEPVLRVLQLRS